VPRDDTEFAFDIPATERPVRITLNDGGVGYEDADGESFWDGWATVDDLIWGLQQYSRLTEEDARTVAEEAVRRWQEALGPDHDFRNFRSDRGPSG
jgi:hypothetical protein